MLELAQHTEGVVLQVRVHPGARRAAIDGIQSGALKVSVTAAPERGKANKAVIELLAKALNLKKSQLEIIAGETAAQKKVLVRGVQRDDLLELVTRAAGLARKRS